MTEKPLSTRKSVQNRTEILLGTAFFASAAITFFKPEAGSTLMVLYGALTAAVGYSGGQYMKGETARPSGSPAKPSPLDHTPTPEAR